MTIVDHYELPKATFWFQIFRQVFEVYESLPEPSLKAMDRVVSSAIDLCTFIYMGVGIAGYLAFADTHFTGIDCFDVICKVQLEINR